MRYSIITFGCRVNQADSLALEEELRRRGASACDLDQADLVVVNTCSVTASADQGARQAVRRVARVNPGARVVVTGCYATRRAAELAELPNVAAVVPNDDKPRLVALVLGAGPIPPRRDLSTAERFGEGDGSCGAAIEPGIAGRTAFTLRVQTGCAEPCTYCIIPSTRGAPRSTPVEMVLEEIGRITAAGFKEVVLTGVHLGSYGRDLIPRSSLAELMSRLPERFPRALFRISSLEPMDCSPDIVSLVADHDCFASHFHLPLQHASHRVLAAMRRPYTLPAYAALVDDIRARISDAAIGCDVIVGFPGETDADFESLTRYLEGSPLTHLHVFPYSDRPGTVASALDAKVHGAVVRERARRVRDISQALARRFRESQQGTIHRALTIDDGSHIVTGNYLKARIPEKRPRNQWVVVRMTGVGDPMSADCVTTP